MADRNAELAEALGVLHQYNCAPLPDLSTAEWQEKIREKVEHLAGRCNRRFLVTVYDIETGETTICVMNEGESGLDRFTGQRLSHGSTYREANENALLWLAAQGKEQK
jgi:hypothetical protein